ncbi:MAG: VCBS repeat-containing protein [Candidatus Midichloria mitochondrii]|uniref:VCBS repeat-containing protein n=1 Tax=Midichloria mitochondrii (strain IricVA) TaxID=696127 RepID=F7XUN5_MIDMI|nr:VCBS repeat-containing protein [Candidatus Midichloria mitochondrii]AEI88384.1 hypothetical protein midi_00058 [Candidatus Midichloria mitochondrii IricVA]MDJ1256970.1 VCBS repeat-containing protein [Candidatus Midichloria mitochondrii]MDJ1288720.1 VCBS repeat-containing protein [Candidatus Midichloria mitochondrii]MDJ1299544.1 VCBS repeat-containing protein [Candidatus Midichloria mitochondrii]MDJ1313394.1 VCBS repeat-containing protein [Candidatus Midichloria mitochondrii]
MGGGSFQYIASYALGSGPAVITAADLNNDGKIDLVSTNSMSNNISLLIGNGDGSFKPAISCSVGAYLSPGSTSVLINKGDGTFQFCSNL